MCIEILEAESIPAHVDEVITRCVFLVGNSFHVLPANPLGSSSSNSWENMVSNKWNTLMCTQENKAIQISLVFLDKSFWMSSLVCTGSAVVSLCLWVIFFFFFFDIFCFFSSMFAPSGPDWFWLRRLPWRKYVVWSSHILSTLSIIQSCMLNGNPVTCPTGKFTSTAYTPGSGCHELYIKTTGATGRHTGGMGDLQFS